MQEWQPCGGGGAAESWSLHRSTRPTWLHTVAHCIKNNHQVLVDILLADEPYIDAPTKTGVTPFFRACSKGHLRMVEKLLATGINIDKPTKAGMTPLYTACQNGHLEVVNVPVLACSVQRSHSC